MKTSLKLLAASLAAVTAMSCTSLTALAGKLRIIDGTAYTCSESGETEGKYTGWAKTSKGRVYYKNGEKVTKKTVINGVCYVFTKKGICKGRYTGFAKKKYGKVYYMDGILMKERTFTANDGYTYTADSFGYLTGGPEDDVDPSF